MYDRPDICTTFPLAPATAEESILPASASAPVHRDPGSLTLTTKHAGGELQWEHLRFPEPIKTTRTLLTLDGEFETGIDTVGMGAVSWAATLD